MSQESPFNEGEAPAAIHFRLPDATRPRLGFLLNSFDAEKTGLNFEFCDGSRANVDLETLEQVRESCEHTTRVGTYNLVSAAADAGIPIILLDNKYNEIGSILITADEGGQSFSAEAKVDAMWAAAAAEMYPNFGLETILNVPEADVWASVDLRSVAVLQNPNGGKEAILRDPSGIDGFFLHSDLLGH